MRKLAVLLVTLAFVLPAFGYDIIWNGASENDITIELQVDCYIYIEWQDLTIEFDGSSDWWSTQLMGLAYQSCPDDEGKNAPESWAGDKYYAGATGRFYESGDGGVIFVHTNNDLSMYVQTNGDLKGTWNSSNNTIPTWFTCCLAPFMIDDQVLNGTVPGSNGHYLYDAAPPSNTFSHGDNGDGFNHPNQYAFSCAGEGHTWQLGPMAPEIEGTIKFLARIERHGMADPGDHYQTTLNVWFTTPSTPMP